MKQLVGRGISRDKLMVRRQDVNFLNDRNELPSVDAKGELLKYREFDINNKIPNKPRDAERFLMDNKGHIYYTNNHYASFLRVR
ncbi:hypothetical protein EEJ46_10675 [Lactiplantibacillus plantarum]|nr:hypothetical protein EEJ46_10675 [Lactiplantibacillus plantarum]